ncbi:calvin cycle protein CP12-3, chloroplastic [Lactuca sativa]|uniref:calvin cycle protein CP12-3, chloroplastic n=1 Tax=Lactuca sativa TaxID=4236 RepID=UPI000CADD46F|nr:calvin cycle protein CP12-3, chloroplastic [Lactuca sativa]
MEISVMSFKLPSSFRSIQVTAANPIYTPPICDTKRAARCRRISVVVNGIGGGSAKYKGTQMREQKLTELIESKVAEATQVCEGDRDSDECKVAWDEVEEVSQAKADLRRKLEENRDPLQSFCEENPETDECRIYED